MICVIDYGMGNLRSVSKAIENLGGQVCVSDNPKKIERSDKLILPGVGGFGSAMRELRKRRLIEPIKKSIEKNKPFLGICLGLQLLFDRSEESFKIKGLSILKGSVRRLKSKPTDFLKIPHMGWNRVDFVKKSPLIKGLNDYEYFYFVHSYYGETDENSIVLGKTKYGRLFTSMIDRAPLFAVQFHPEKSQKAGLQILKNFIHY